MPDSFCYECGEKASLTCTRCKSARYCSAACQRKHWQTSHRTACRPPQSQAAALSAPATVAAVTKVAAAAAADEPVGLHWTEAQRRAWESAEIGRRAPALLEDAPRIGILTMVHSAVTLKSLPGGRGRGLIAARPLRRGETLLIDPAIAWLPQWEMAGSAGAADVLRVQPLHREHLDGLLLQMSPFGLSAGSAAADDFARAGSGMHDLTRSQAISSVLIHTGLGVLAAATGVESISEVSDGAPRVVTALCPVISLLNHSCRPNCGWTAVSRSLSDVRLRVVAQRDVRAGEELSISYVPSTQQREARRRGLEQYEFDCKCDRCTASCDDTQVYVCAACGASALLETPPTGSESKEPSAQCTVCKASSPVTPPAQVEKWLRAADAGALAEQSSLHPLHAGFAARCESAVVHFLTSPLPPPPAAKLSHLGDMLCKYADATPYVELFKLQRTYTLAGMALAAGGEVDAARSALTAAQSTSAAAAYPPSQAYRDQLGKLAVTPPAGVDSTREAWASLQRSVES